MWYTPFEDTPLCDTPDEMCKNQKDLCLPKCGNDQVVIVTPKNVQYEDVSFFIKASDEEKFLFFEHGEIKGKWAPVSYSYSWRMNED